MMDSPPLFFAILALCTLILYLLPFIPAWHEWKYKTDSKPFRVNLQDRTIVEYNIRMFEEDIQHNFSELIQQSLVQKTKLAGLTNDREYLVIYNKEPILFSNTELPARKTNKVILFSTNGCLENDFFYQNKVVAKGTLHTGKNNKFNGLMADKNIFLGENNTVLNLIYSKDSIIINSNSTLNCYTKALNRISFNGNSEFQYLYASRIEFGQVLKKTLPKAIDILSPHISRRILHEDYRIPECTEAVNHWVAKANLTIAEQCHLIGNIKCYKDLRIEKNSIIVGSVICENNIFIEENCTIQGPIVANKTITIGSNCLIGSCDSKTSIIANKINCSSGCLLSGLVLAKNKGVYLHSIIN